MATFDKKMVVDCVAGFNAAIEKKDVAKAVEMGRLAIQNAQAALNNNPGANQAYYESVIKTVSKFLADPQIKEPNKKASASTGNGNVKEDKIKSTDWFAAPIPDLKIKDIAGLQDVKTEFAVNVFAPINPALSDIYKKYRGDEIGLQILLYGPPGTGKTHVVKCLAGELGCKIAVVQIKDVMANLVGDGAKIISEIFEQAKKYDRCIIFFDEIDAIASSREGDDSRHTKEQLTTLLTNMDGFTSKTKPGQIRIVIAATNRPWALDSAVKRGGRFDTQIYIPLPDDAAREKLVALALGKDKDAKGKANVPVADDVTLDWLVEKTKGYAGADIKAICRQAVTRPLKREIMARLSGAQETDDCVTRNDFEEVFGKYINSLTRETLMQFEAYKLSMEYEEMKEAVEKCESLVILMYHNHMRATTGDYTNYPDEFKIPDTDKAWFKAQWNLGIVEKFVGEKYDLEFIEQLEFMK